MIGGLQLANHADKLLVHIGKALQIGSQISPEYSQVGLTAAVDKDGVINMMLFIVLLYHRLCMLHIIFQQTDLPIFVQHLRRAELHAVHININGTLHTTSAALTHPPPILERVADKQIGRNRSNGIIPVTHLHCVQRDFYHRTVSSIFGHCNPVAHLQHVIGRQLHTGNKPHNRILKHQHQYSGRSAQTGQQ